MSILTLVGVENMRKLLINEINILKETNIKIDIELKGNNVLLSEKNKELIELDKKYKELVDKQKEIDIRKQKQQKIIEDQKQLIQKYEYVKRCWEYMVKRQLTKQKQTNIEHFNEIDPIFVGKLDDCTQYTWDDIISHAHTSHFNGLFVNKCKVIDIKAYKLYPNVHNFTIDTYPGNFL